jgi:hypothetical protein
VQASGRIFLLVTGILYIISGIIGFIGAVSVDMIGQTAGGMGNVLGVQGVGRNLGKLAVYMSISSIYAFVIGIIGISNRDNPDKGSTLMTLGIIALIGEIISIFIFQLFSFSTIALLAIPICYIYGASKNMDEVGKYRKGNSTNSNYAVFDKKCRQCNKIFSGTYNGCPNCGSSLYEITNSQDTNYSVTPDRVNHGDTWHCKKCSTSNPVISSSCKDCGEYK